VTSVALERPSKPIVEGYRSIAHLRRSELYDVYDAWSEEREARCVVKVLRPDRRMRPSDRRRVIREGELLLSLTHPHIVRAYEVHGEPIPYIVLEAATGATLGRLIEERRLSLAELARLATQLGSALGYLHRKGYLHLDLKPSNITCDRGYVRLLDLSIARPPGLVAAGIGTARYLSPEQARGGVLSATADVWGLGCILYESATGGAPFQDDAGPDARVAAPLKANGRLRPAIAWTIMRCLEPVPEQRPRIADVVRAFAPFA